MKAPRVQTEIEELFDAPAPPSRLRRYALALLALASVAGIIAIAIVARNAPDALAELRVRDERVGVRHGTGDYFEASEGEDLGVGDVVRTDGTGQAQIDLFDGSLARLDVDSEVHIDELVDRPEGRVVGLDIKSGRIWNRVAEHTSDSDRYEVAMPNAIARVRGTTFMIDCRGVPRCYVVGVTGDTEVESDVGVKQSVKEGDCVEATAGGLAECDEKQLGLIDQWAKENLADDQQLALENSAATPLTPTPSPTPSPTLAPLPAPVAPTATPTSAPKPTPTDEPNTPRPTDTPEPTKTPKTPKPSASPSASPCETGEPDSDCFGP